MLPPVLSVKCEEPEGDIIREISPLEFTPNVLKEFWEKARVYRTLFNQEIRNDYDRFLPLILRRGLTKDSIEPTGLFWRVDPNFVGVFYMTNIIAEQDCLAHYTFFDGRHRGRVELCEKMLSYAFNKYNLRRVTVEIPLYATDKTHNFVSKSLGFRKEGRKRKAILFDNEWFDVIVYGLLREEVTGNGSKNIGS